MTKLKIKKIELTAKLIDMDFEKVSPGEIIANLGMVEIKLEGIVETKFVEELAAFIEKRTT